MNRKLSLYTLLFFSLSATAQFKNDQVAYTTISPDDLCTSLQNNKGYLLLDVRSPGEHNDTSQYAGLNIGHLNGAVNINIRELGSRLSEINAYKDQPVYIYCSHSQRSRRAGKMLADSGFKKVYNVNGGLTSFYYTNAREKGCLQSLLVSNNKYKIISATDLCNKLSSKNNNLFILDVRYDSAYRHISTDMQDNAYGTIKGTVSIPWEDLPNKYQSIPKNKEIIITDLDGTDAAKAAKFLTEKGYDKVSFLIEGMDRLLSTDRNEVPCKNEWYVAAPETYNIISTKEFGRAANNEQLLLDIREASEFNNTHKNEFRNIGHLKNAVNIPLVEINSRLSEIEKYKNKEVIVYGFGGSRESYEAAHMLTKNGFTKISVLSSGIFGVRWAAFNVKGQEQLRNLVTDVPEVNR